MSAIPTSTPTPPPCLHQRRCPISQTPCPGECIYSEIMQSVGLGVAVFDLRTPSLLFLNRAGRGFFTRHGLEPDLERLKRLMFPPGVPLEELPLESQGEPLLLGTRLIGYTLYRSGPIAWAFFRDITEKARLESIAESVETMNNIGYVFSAVRHELGNPVNSVKAALSVLRANLDTFPRPLVREYLDRLTGELERVEVLLRSLRSFSMYEQLEPVPTDLHELLEGFVGLAAPDLAQKGVRLALDPDSRGRALVDPRALQQALLNVVANAADAAQGRPGAEIVISATVAEGLARLTVADNGVGMSAALLADAFKPFHTTKAHGTGLGLVITRKLLLKMSGTIELESEEGAGTRVQISLPLAPRAVAA